MVIVGSGAGGSAVAWTLARAGYRVVVLEKGPEFTRADYIHDEILGRASHGMFLPSLDDDPHVMVDPARGNGRPFRTSAGWTACCVGGGTSHMGATLQRLHPHDFRLRQHLGPFEELADWPYGYDDLEPYYCSAEWLVGVSGHESGMPAEMFRSRPFPMPPLPSNALGDRFDRTCHALGLHPIQTPRGINSVPYGGRPACEFCDVCSGFGCPVGARGSAQETMLHDAIATGACTVLPTSMVTRVVLGTSGRVTGVRYLDVGGAEHELRAAIVCVSCGAVESARLLLLSACPACPDGLANSSGLVGRHLQFHCSSSGWAAFDPSAAESGAPAYSARFMNRALMDYYFLPPGAGQYAKGGFLTFRSGRPGALAIADDIATGLGVDGETDLVWGAELKRLLRNAVRAAVHVDFEVFHDGFANAQTYVTLDPEVKDRWGLPAARIQHRALEHYEASGQWLVERCLEILRAMGAERVATRAVGIRNPYLVTGTCRAGSDPRTSVLNAFCRAHDVRNLFVVDGSFMPSSGGAPATLTIIANALRAADYMVSHAKAGEF